MCLAGRLTWDHSDTRTLQTSSAHQKASDVRMQPRMPFCNTRARQQPSPSVFHHSSANKISPECPQSCWSSISTGFHRTAPAMLGADQLEHCTVALRSGCPVCQPIYLQETEFQNARVAITLLSGSLIPSIPSSAEYSVSMSLDPSICP